MCPDDIDSQCYTPVGPFKFLARQVATGSEVEVCVSTPISDRKKCNSGKNASKDAPGTIRVEVPDIPREEDGSDGNNDSASGNNDGQDDYVNCNIEDYTDGSYSCPDDITSKCHKIDD